MFAKTGALIVWTDKVMFGRGKESNVYTPKVVCGTRKTIIFANLNT